jgi:hypothetical protein
MARRAKYDALREYLSEKTARRITLTFDEVAEIVDIPDSARRYEWWWSNEDVNTTTHVQCKAWQGAGYAAEPNMRAGAVTFVRLAA